MSNLDEILHAQPATLPAPLEPRPHRRHDYTGWMQAHPSLAGAEHEPDPLRDLLGHEYFDPEPQAPRARQVVPEGMHLIGDLAKALGKSPRTIRLWIKGGIIPESPSRTTGPLVKMGPLGKPITQTKRMWPSEEINAIVEIAQEEGVMGDFHKPMANTNFVIRVHDALAELRTTQAHASGRA